MSKLLVVSAHPDDETISCGGTLLRLADEGWELYWLILTDVYPGSIWSDIFIEARKEEIPQVSSFFNFKKTVNLGYPTTTLDEIPLNDLHKSISQVISEITPDWILLPNHSDIHSDHRRAFEATFSACKSFRAPYIKKILMYECISETEYATPFPSSAFIPNFYMDISAYFNRKIEGVMIYKSEIKKAPFPRSKEVIEALARFRGSRIGVDFAESYMSIFESF